MTKKRIVGYHFAPYSLNPVKRRITIEVEPEPEQSVSDLMKIVSDLMRGETLTHMHVVAIEELGDDGTWSVV